MEEDNYIFHYEIESDIGITEGIRGIKFWTTKGEYVFGEFTKEVILPDDYLNRKL